MPYFAKRGYDSYAPSFRGQGTSERVPGAKPGTLLAAAADVASIVALLPQPPVVVAHSLGGLILQRHAQQQPLFTWRPPRSQGPGLRAHDLPLVCTCTLMDRLPRSSFLPGICSSP